MTSKLYLGSTPIMLMNLSKDNRSVRNFVDSNHTLQKSNIFLSLDGIQDIGDYVLKSSYAYMNLLTGNVDMSSLLDVSGQEACQEALIGTRITSIDLSGLTQVSGNFSLTYMCNGCQDLVRADLSNLVSVTGEGSLIGLFSGCPSLTTVDISNLIDATGINCCTEMFGGCSALTSITCNIQTMGEGSCVGMFISSGLTSATIPVTTVSINSCANMLADCVDLVTVSFPYVTETYGFTFNGLCAGCTSLTTLSFPSLVRIQGERGFGEVCNQCSSLTTVDLSSLQYVSGNYSLSYAFNGCSSLTSLDLSNVMNFSNEGICSNMCMNCTSLANVYFTKLHVLGKLAMVECFYNCSSLTRVDFPCLDELEDYSLAGAFGSCTNLANLYFYNLNINSFDRVYDAESCFADMLYGVDGCTVHFPIALQSLIGSWNTVLNGFNGTNTTVLFDLVQNIVGNNGVTYTRSQEDSGSNYTAWKSPAYILHYTSGTQEPTVGDTIYSDSTLTTSVTTISSIS